jgi:hypothetical protein
VTVKNLAASVHARLQNQARATNRPFQELLLPARLSELVTFLAKFLLPIARACESGESFDQSWSPGGPWIKRFCGHREVGRRRSALRVGRFVPHRLALSRP